MLVRVASGRDQMRTWTIHGIAAAAIVADARAVRNGAADDDHACGIGGSRQRIHRGTAIASALYDDHTGGPSAIAGTRLARCTGARGAPAPGTVRNQHAVFERLLNRE